MLLLLLSKHWRSWFVIFSGKELKAWMRCTTLIGRLHNVLVWWTVWVLVIIVFATVPFLPNESGGFYMNLMPRGDNSLWPNTIPLTAFGLPLFGFIKISLEIHLPNYWFGGQLHTASSWHRFINLILEGSLAYLLYSLKYFPSSFSFGSFSGYQGGWCLGRGCCCLGFLSSL